MVYKQSYGNYSDLIFESLGLISKYQCLNWIRRDQTVDQGYSYSYWWIGLNSGGGSTKILVLYICTIIKMWKKGGGEIETKLSYRNSFKMQYLYINPMLISVGGVEWPCGQTMKNIKEGPLKTEWLKYIGSTEIISVYSDISSDYFLVRAWLIQSPTDSSVHQR